MVTKKHAGVRAALAIATLCGGLALGPAPASAQAVKISPYFPVPSAFNMNGVMRDALLGVQASWLKNGLDNLKKAQTEAQAAVEKAKGGAQDALAAAEAKLKAIDDQIVETEKEIAVANDNSPSRDVQGERKRHFLLHLNQWINELNHLATEQMKIAIMKDGAEAMVAQNRNYQLSEQADALEKAKHDPSIENWGK